MFNLIISGIIIGILSSAPLGPAGVLCIQRTLNRGRRSGFISGCGIALADTIFAILAVFSVSYIKNLITEIETPLQLAVGVVVVVVGIKIVSTNPIKQFRYRRIQQSKLLKDFVSIFLLTINPINLLPVLFFTGLMKVGVVSLQQGSIVVAAVLSGALLWWFGLTALVAHYRKYFGLRQMWWINKLSGFLILVLGSLACIQALVKIAVKLL